MGKSNGYDAGIPPRQAKLRTKGNGTNSAGERGASGEALVLSPVLHLGFSNYVFTDRVIALIDYKCGAAKALVRRARESGEGNIYDFSRGRRIQTLVALDDGIFCLSNIPRKALLRRLGLIENED